MSGTQKWSIDLSMNVRSKVDSYRSLLKHLLHSGLRSYTHLDAWNARDKIDSYLCIRHDVDHDIDLALAMAKIEKNLGIVSSYYLLPPGDYDSSGNYYGNIDNNRIVKNQHMLTIAKQIQNMGHEVGLHNDFLQLSRIVSRPIYDVIAFEIDDFDKHGITIKGSASHGSRFARQHGYINYEIFSDRHLGDKSKKNITLDDDDFILPCISMKELGLEYEAYDLKRQNRVSDVGGKIMVNSNKQSYETNFLDEKFENCDVHFIGRTVALIHPEHWVEFDALTIATNIKN